MADPTSLFDTLAGAAGHPVNRAGLNSYVATSQAQNGLRSAQTTEALLKAQSAVDEQDAQGKLEGALGSYFGAGHEAKAHAAATIMRSGYGNAQVALQAIQEAQKSGALDTLGDPNKLGTPEQTAASQVTTGKLAGLTDVHDNYAVPAGLPDPVVHQSPLGLAKAHNQEATGNLRQEQADNPAAFHPAKAGSGPLTPDDAAVMAKYLQENPGAASNLRSLLAAPHGPDVIRALLHNQGLDGSAPTPLANGITVPTGVGMAEQAAIRKGFAGGLEGRQVGALGTMAQHSRLFDQIATELDNGNSVPTNTIANLWAKTFQGSAVPSNLHMAAGFLAREAVKATVNAGAGTGAERQLDVGENASSGALHGAADTLRKLAGGQLHTLDLRARRGGVDIGTMLDPDAQALYNFHSGGPSPIAPGPGPEPAAAVAPSVAAGGERPPPQALAHLKEGVIQPFANGQEWTLRGGQPVRVK